MLSNLSRNCNCNCNHNRNRNRNTRRDYILIAVLACLALPTVIVVDAPSCQPQALQQAARSEVECNVTFETETANILTTIEVEGVGLYYENDKWDQLTIPIQQYLREQGWTSTMWDGGYEPYFLLDWDEMKPEWNQALTALGWTEESWISSDADPTYRPVGERTPWDHLTKEQQEAARVLGFTERELSYVLYMY